MTEDIEIVDALNVVLGRDLGHVCRVEDPPEEHFRVGVGVVEDHAEELGGRLQQGLVIHLETDCSAVAQVPTGAVVLEHAGHQLALVVLELLLLHDPEPQDRELPLEYGHLTVSSATFPAEE